MNYIVDLDRGYDFEVFKMFSRSVNYVRDKYNFRSTNVKELIKLYENEFEVKVVGSEDGFKYKIIFDNEQEYFWFKLKWG